MKPVTMEDLLCYRFLSRPLFNPSGSRAAFVVSAANRDENAYESRLWLYENGSVRQLTDLGKESSYIWLDDDRILFPAVRSSAEKKRADAKEEFTAYYVLDLNGGEAMPFFTVPLAVQGIKVVDPSHFVILASADKRCPDLYRADEQRRSEIRKEQEENRDYEIFDELPFWSNGAGVTNGHFSRLFSVSLDPFSLEPISDEGEQAGSFAVLGDEVFYASSPCLPKMRLNGFTLYGYDMRTRSKREVYKSDVMMSPSMLEAVGSALWLSASEGKRYGLNETEWFYTLDPSSGALSLLRAEEYSTGSSVGSDCRYGGGQSFAVSDGSLFHTTTREGNAYLHRLYKDGTDCPVFTRPGSIDSFDIRGSAVLAVALYDMRPQELYRIDLVSGDFTRVSDFNGDALKDRYVAEPQALSVISEGLEIGGWVLKPIGYEPDKTYPAVFDIHGGPKTVYGPVFYHEMQVWAGRGYFVFFCNPKGSDGRDNAFADIRGGYGATDYQNLMDFADAALKAWPAIDPKRVCETGGSYGGFMTNWIIGHTDRFCCAASQRSISNWLSFCGVSDIGCWFAPDQTAGDLYENPKKLWEQSPLRYAKNVKTPTLFIHSDEDYRCPLEQGLQMYAALLDRGVPARMCLFHGENHELSRSGKPLHRLRRLQEITDWFDRYSAVEP